jgi:hypothetical protein
MNNYMLLQLALTNLGEQCYSEYAREIVRRGLVRNLPIYPHPQEFQAVRSILVNRINQ